MSSLRQSPANGLEYYFAFGSNMHLAQMASRCSGSSFEGMATLLDYRWQINERGYANVIKSAKDDWVEGLVFLITEADKRALDGYEGVASGCYEVKKMPLQFKAKAQQSHNNVSDAARTGTQITTPSWSEPSSGLLKPVDDIGVLSQQNFSQAAPHNLKDGLDNSSPTAAKKIGQPNRISQQQDGQSQHIDFSQHEHALGNTDYNKHGGHDQPRSEEFEEITAFVYYSSEFTQDGDIMPEYIFRMNNAITDALANGVSAKYIAKYLKPLIPDNNSANAFVGLYR